MPASSLSHAQSELPATDALWTVISERCPTADGVTNDCRADADADGSDDEPIGLLMWRPTCAVADEVVKAFTESGCCRRQIKEIARSSLPAVDALSAVILACFGAADCRLQWLCLLDNGDGMALLMLLVILMSAEESAGCECCANHNVLLGRW